MYITHTQKLVFISNKIIDKLSQKLKCFIKLHEMYLKNLCIIRGKKNSTKKMFPTNIPIDTIFNHILQIFSTANLVVRPIF